MLPIILSFTENIYIKNASKAELNCQRCFQKDNLVSNSSNTSIIYSRFTGMSISKIMEH